MTSEPATDVPAKSEMGLIVVGVDGSGQSIDALKWALQEARIRHAHARVVYVYDHRPPWAYKVPDARDLTDPDRQPSRSFEEEATQAREHAEVLVATTLEQAGGASGLHVETLAIEDSQPARALVEQARRADLLVVGSRGRGGFGSLILGSVSQQCAQHASVPVVIVRR